MKDATRTDTPLPTFEHIRAEERPTPNLVDAPAFTLTAPVSRRTSHQLSLLNAAPENGGTP